MKQGIFEIAENAPMTEKVMRMRLVGDVSAVERPGQFAELRVEGFFLRRPLSVCRRDVTSFTVLYERVGRGTEAMAALPAGEKLDVLTGLGNGFDLSLAGDRPLLIGGGTGVSPLFWLAEELLKRGARPAAVLGFNTAQEVFYADEFEALGVETLVTTADGSFGIPGLVTAAMDRAHSAFYACGPEAMLRAVCEKSGAPGQLSLDRRMGCGFGACMGCSVKTRDGMRRVCKEGPVFGREEVLWES